MEFPNLLTKILESQEGVNTAMSLQGDCADALTLVYHPYKQTDKARSAPFDLSTGH